MSTAAIVAGTAAAGLAGSAITAGAAGHAADTQAQAATQAAQLQHEDAQAALGFQKDVYGVQQQQMAPWLQAGHTGLANLQYMMGLPVNGTAYVPGQMGPTQVPAAASPTSNFGTNAWQTALNNAYGPNGTVTPGLINNLNKGVAAEVPDALSMARQPQQYPQLSSLVNPNLGSPGSLLAPYPQTFTPPTDVTEQNDPGYKARLRDATQAMEQSAAARGGVLSGGTARQLGNLAQDYASNEYNNVYNRAYNTYSLGANTYWTNQANQYNRLASLAGLGQTSATQLGAMGQNAAGNIGNILMTSGNQIGQNINNAGAARASGYVGGANAWGGALNNLGTLAMMYPILNSMNNAGAISTPLQFPTSGSLYDSMVTG